MFTGTEFMAILAIGIGLGALLIVFKGASGSKRLEKANAALDQLLKSKHQALLGPDTQVFSSIAFALEEPGKMGWKKDIGGLVIRPDGIHLISGTQHLAFSGPAEGKLFQHPYMYWRMVHIQATLTGQSDPTTVLLVVKGCPGNKFSAKPEEIEQESREIIAAIKITTEG
jgi:hypothetical protein